MSRQPYRPKRQCQKARKNRKTGARHLFRAPQPFENTQLSGAKRAVCPRFFDFFTASDAWGYLAAPSDRMRNRFSTVQPPFKAASRSTTEMDLVLQSRDFTHQQ